MAQDPLFNQLEKLNALRFAAISDDPKRLTPALHEITDLFQNIFDRLEKVEAAIRFFRNKEN